MPIYKAKLSDGRTVRFESETEPSHDEILAAVESETSRKREELASEKRSLQLRGEVGEGVERGIDLLGGTMGIVSKMNPFRQAVDLPLTVGRAIGLDEPESFAPIVTPEQAQAAWDALHPSARNIPEELRVPSKLDAEIAEGVSRFVGENVSGMTSPSVAAPMIAGVAAPRLLAPGAARTVTEPIARGFQTEMIEHLPSAIERLRQAETLPEQIVAGGNVALGAGLPLAIERGLAPRTGRVVPPERPPPERPQVAETEPAPVDPVVAEAIATQAPSAKSEIPSEAPRPAPPEPVPPVQPESASAEIAPGPGAASPAEFALRQRGGVEPPQNNPVAIDASAKPDIEVARRNKDYHVFNRANSGQWAFDFGRLGQAAKSAWERMALGEFKMRESIKRDIDTYVNGVMSSLPREMRSSGGKAFFDVLDGKKMEQITAEWESKPGGDKVIAAAESLKTRLEEIRSTIRDTKRESYRGYLQGLERSALEDLFKKNINDRIDTSAMTKDQFGDALTLNEFPDDWGIADGSYLPHLFFGSWKISAKLPGEEGAGFVARAETAAQAKAKIYELSKNNPEYANAQWTIGQDVVITPDMIRLGDKKFWNMISRMKEQTAGEVNVKEAVQGIIGRKAGKQKWFGSLQERLGFKNYSRDFRNVMGAYLNGFHRWKELSEMQRDTAPLIERVKAEGRPNAARRLEDLMENLWGKPAATTIEFDSFVQRIPGLRDHIKPLALDRWSRNIRSMVSLLTLRTLRFALVNRLQPLQGLYPLVGERLLVRGKALQHSPEGKALLDEAGVRLDPGQYAETRAGVSKVRDFMERFTGERSNQELAFLSMYLHGVEQGMPKAEAIKYAKLRGQLMTQFTPLVVDTPQMLHGPIASMMFQFKRFPIKQAELTANMVREGNIGGIARMLAVFALVGGASVFLRQAWTDPEKRLALRRKLEKEMGSKGADALMYGLPGLLNADLSGSLVLAEEPFGDDVFSKAARTVAGPAVSIAAETTRAAMTEEREPMSSKDKAVALMRRFPALRPITELMTFGDDEILSPDGEVKYRRKVQDALAGLGAFRSANEANMQTAVSAIVELKKEDQRLKNAYYVARAANADLTGIRAEIDAFNKRWPEVRITAQDLADYVQYRRRNRDKTDVERVAGKKYKKLLPQ